jgi:hypothetical protein
LVFRRDILFGQVVNQKENMASNIFVHNFSFKSLKL